MKFHETKVLGFKCKTKDCKLQIPLTKALFAIFPDEKSVKLMTCKNGHTNSYTRADHIDTGGRIQTSEPETF